MRTDFEIGTSSLKNIPGLWEHLQTTLGPRSLAFLERMYMAGLAKYKSRLAGLGFSQKRRVLDAGCGLGQWTLSLAGMCNQVYGIDISADRIRACQRISQAVGLTNIAYVVGELDILPFRDNYFEATFCYGVLNFTDYPQAIREISRTLERGGLFYLSMNGIGRYIYDIIKNPYPTPDFSPRRYGLWSLWNTLWGKRKNLSVTNGAVAISHHGTMRALEQAGLQVIAVGAEGTIGNAKEPFLPGQYLSMQSTFDVIARKY
jgi:SAM-dependent methyltransferase